ncbi:TonB-dependent receptor family protein [Aliikangiella maris]|uniref:TonB-dependent siderophore receptor n=2 Tax=Aliikangiella maris TaxID=3162458 RepID=A0ABV2BUB5_9GAMM
MNIKTIFSPKPMVFAITTLMANSYAMAEQSTDKGENNKQDESKIIRVYGEWLGNSEQAEVLTYPGGRNIISEDKLQLGGVRNLEDAFRSVPGFKVQDETGTGILPNISIRGLNPGRSGQVQILLDGVPYSLAPYGHLGLSLFPFTMESVAQIDVVRGGAAVHYGPNNVGGVINFIPKAISDEFSTQIRNRYTLFEKGRHLNDFYVRTGGHVNKDVALQLQLNTARGESFREHSNTEVDNAIFNSRISLSDDSYVKLLAQYYNVTSELPGALPLNDYAQDPTQSKRPYDYFDADTTRFSATFNKGFDSFAELNWINFYQKSNRRFDFGYPFDAREEAAELRASPRSFEVYGSEPRLSFLIDNETVTHQFTLGARYVTEDIDYAVTQNIFTDDTVNTLRDWYFKTNAYALYTSYTLSLADDRLSITPGVRYENVAMDYRDGITAIARENDISEILPGLTLGFEYSEQWFIFANTQKSLRPPQVTQITREGDVESELANNFEAGFRYTPQDGLTFTANFYQIDFDDQIQFDRPSLSFKNLGETRHKGYELEATWEPSSLDGLFLHAGYTYLDAVQLSGDNQGKTLPFASDKQWIFEARYAYQNTDFAISATHFSEAFSDAANTLEEDELGSKGLLPDYWLLNGMIQHRFYQHNQQSLAVSLIINNLLDEEYYFRGVDVSPWGRQPAPSRSFSIQLDYQF